MKKSKLVAYALGAIFLSICYRQTITSNDLIDRLKKTAQVAKAAIYLPYNLTQVYILQTNPKVRAYRQALLKLTQRPFPFAPETYTALNIDPKNPFLTGIGTAVSQTKITNNIIHPTEHLGELLQKQSQKSKDPKKWLADRWGYVIRSIADIQCNDCNKTILFESIEPNHTIVKPIVKNIAQNNSAKSLELSACPHCNSANITQLPKTIPTYSDCDENALLQQLKILGLFNQPAATTMPGYRLSGELADLLDRNGNIDPKKLQQQVTLAQKFHHPLWVFHHYANPTCKPHLFEQKTDIPWFANTCAEFIKACPGLTHVCPISQIMGFGMQVSRQKMLPPFSCNIDTAQFLQNIIDAQVAASKAMKAVNPNLKVLVSHQWKPMKPLHNFGDPRYAIEFAASSVADRMYNQKFVQLLQPHTDSFDGIALSIYPAMYFDTITPCGNNCTGKLDPESALEAIVQAHNAFPDKEIHIIETGCNNNDPEIKKQFVDMTLYVCKLAQDLGVPVKSCYFWGHANNPYFEWNKLPGTSFFGPFENMSVDSINAYGKYLQEILKKN